MTLDVELIERGLTPLSPEDNVFETTLGEEHALAGEVYYEAIMPASVVDGLVTEHDIIARVTAQNKTGNLLEAYSGQALHALSLVEPHARVFREDIEDEELGRHCRVVIPLCLSDVARGQTDRRMDTQDALFKVSLRLCEAVHAVMKVGNFHHNLKLTVAKRYHTKGSTSVSANRGVSMHVAYSHRKMSFHAEVPAGTSVPRFPSVFMSGRQASYRKVVVPLSLPEGGNKMLRDIIVLVRKKDDTDGAGQQKTSEGNESTRPCLVESLTLVSGDGRKRQKLDGMFSGKVLLQRNYGSVSLQAAQASGAGGGGQLFCIPFDYMNDDDVLVSSHLSSTPEPEKSGGPHLPCCPSPSILKVRVASSCASACEVTVLVRYVEINLPLTSPSSPVENDAGELADNAALQQLSLLHDLGDLRDYGNDIISTNPTTGGRGIMQQPGDAYPGIMIGPTSGYGLGSILGNNKGERSPLGMMVLVLGVPLLGLMLALLFLWVLMDLLLPCITEPSLDGGAGGGNAFFLFSDMANGGGSSCGSSSVGSSLRSSSSSFP